MNSTHTHNPAFTKTPCIALAHGFSDDMEISANKSSHLAAIPCEVIRQLREHGVNIEFLGHGLLKDAHLSFAHDGVVFDDADGHNFSDMQHLSDCERKAGRGTGRHAFWTQKCRDMDTDNAVLLAS